MASPTRSYRRRIRFRPELIAPNNWALVERTTGRVVVDGIADERAAWAALADLVEADRDDE
jgi:hypothetical protein